ncbi:MAG: L,D-transpeptidase [Gammaproteobacteria bacterium]|nr:L,D-transpeptidase [Gammaproteobacteria bacterium]
MGIGRQGWATPLGKSTITEKRAHPTWHVPPSIRHDLVLQD